MAETAAARGFSLIEALVALAVLGIVLGGALAAGGASLGSAARGRRDLAMATLAETLLERAGVDLLLDSPVAEGSARGLRWRLERTLADEPSPAAARPGERRPLLWRIEARVADPGGGVFTLTTLDLAAAR